MNLKLKKAKRLNAKIKMSVQGTSGSGKTYSSLLIAYGLCGDWNNIAIVDSENRSASLYEHLGSYSTVELSPPFTPERYIDAIRLCEQAGIEVIIIDSISQCWECLLDYHSSLTGNSFTNWLKVTPRHNAFVSAIVQSPVHIICTIRPKQDYVLNDKNGKVTPEKVGMKPIQREGIEYEFGLSLELTANHKATASKDRTSLFTGQPDFVLSPEVGQQIMNWCNSGSPATEEDVTELISSVATVPDLLNLYNAYPQYQQPLQAKFEERKRTIKQLSTTAATQGAA